MSNEDSLRSKFKTLQIIFLAIVIGCIVFSIILLSPMGKINFDIKQLMDKFFIISSILGILVVFGGNKLGAFQLSNLQVLDTINKKISAFTSARIMKYVFLEAGILASIFIFRISSNGLILLVVALLFVVLLQNYPSKQVFKRDVPLSKDQLQELERV